MGAVRKKIPLDEEWLNITYQVYDIPNHPGTFKERLKELEKFVKLSATRWKKISKDLPYPMNGIPCPIVMAKQTIVKDLKHLDKLYKVKHVKDHFLKLQRLEKAARKQGKEDVRMGGEYA